MGFPESRIIILLSSGPILWMLGGTYWKGFRRIVWPIVVLFTLGWPPKFSRNFLMYSLCSITMFCVNTLPYGDRTPKWLAAVVFGTLILPTVFISRTALAKSFAISLLLLIVLMQITLQHNDVPWKLWESAAGFVQAAGVVIAKLSERGDQRGI